MTHGFNPPRQVHGCWESSSETPIIPTKRHDARLQLHPEICQKDEENPKKFLPKSLILFSDCLFNHPAGYPHDLGNLSSGSSRSSSEERRNLAKYGTKYEVLPPFWCFDVFFTRKVAPDRSYCSSMM